MKLSPALLVLVRALPGQSCAQAELALQGHQPGTAPVTAWAGTAQGCSLTHLQPAGVEPQQELSCLWRGERGEEAVPVAQLTTVQNWAWGGRPAQGLAFITVSPLSQEPSGPAVSSGTLAMVFSWAGARAVGSCLDA